jgi:hypothetical protein
MYIGTPRHGGKNGTARVSEAELVSLETFFCYNLWRRDPTASSCGPVDNVEIPGYWHHFWSEHMFYFLSEVYFTRLDRKKQHSGSIGKNNVLVRTGDSFKAWSIKHTKKNRPSNNLTYVFSDASVLRVRDCVSLFCLEHTLHGRFAILLGKIVDRGVNLVRRPLPWDQHTLNDLREQTQRWYLWFVIVYNSFFFVVMTT